MVPRAVNNHADDLEPVSRQTPGAAAALPLSMETAGPARVPGSVKEAPGRVGEASGSPGAPGPVVGVPGGQRGGCAGAAGRSAGRRAGARRRLRLAGPCRCAPRGSTAAR